MKKTILRISGVCSCVLVLASAFMMPASAVEKDTTKTYTIYQEKVYGSVTMYPVHSTADTYCELKTAGKMAKAYFKYIDSKGATHTETKGTTAKSADYTYNNSTHLTKSTTQSPPNFYMPKKAYSKHRVKVRDGFTWSSEEMNDRPVVG